MLDLKTLREAVTGSAAAFRSVTEYQPAGGVGDKVFPPTYERGEYAMEKRRLPGRDEPVDCVLLDSVQSQANRMELALLDAWERGRIPLPVISVDFAGNGLLRSLKITSLDAPHRIADALLRDSLHGGTAFRRGPVGKRLDDVDARNATALFDTCPTALVFGMWDSTGPKGGMGAKFQRALVSEIVGIDAVFGVKTSSRIDPAQIMKEAGPLYEVEGGGGWTLDEGRAAKDKKGIVKLGKDGRPSEANHGNITPSITLESSVTIGRALQTTTLSLPALRRLRFPLKGTTAAKTDDAARTALAALGICAATLAREQGCDLRSRCLLVPTMAFEWELLEGYNAKGWKRFALSADAAVDLLAAAVKEATEAGLPWMKEELRLAPSPELVALVKKSQELAAASGGERSEG